MANQTEGFWPERQILYLCSSQTPNSLALNVSPHATCPCRVLVVADAVYSPCRRAGDLVEHHVRPRRQPRRSLRSSCHWGQRNLAVGSINPPARLCSDSAPCRPPPVDVHTSDSLLVHVTNSLDQPTTLHHHGMFFNSTPWMDGAMGVSEWQVS